jgi:hypothetical protein
MELFFFGTRVARSSPTRMESSRKAATGKIFSRLY